LDPLQIHQKLRLLFTQADERTTMVEVSEVLNMYKLYSRMQPFFGPLLGTRDANTDHQSISLKGVYVRPSVPEVDESSQLFLAIASNRALFLLFV
jgi:hypothetical protein